MADEKLRIIFEGVDKNTGQLLFKMEKGVKGVGKSAEKAGEQTKSMKDKLISFAKGLGVAAIALSVVRKAMDFGRESIQVASDVSEMQSKFETVFGEVADITEKELGRFSAAVQRSKFDLQEMAAGVQDTFVPLGFARDEAASLSVALVKLAVDVASFDNKLESDVMRDFQSAMVGNTETVRKYGIVITQARLDQELLNSGIAGGVQGATEAEKAFARYQLILEGTSDAQGDAARTADSYENVSKGLEAALKDLQVVIGDGLIPTLTEAKGLMTQLVRGWTESAAFSALLTKALKRGIIVQMDVVAITEELRQGTTDYAEVTERLTAIIQAQDAAEAERIDTLTETRSEYQDAKQRADEYIETTQNLTEATIEAALADVQLKADLDFLKAAYDDNIISVEEYATNVALLKEGLWELDEQYKEGIEAITVYQTNTGGAAGSVVNLMGAARDAESALLNMSTALKDASQTQIATEAMSLLQDELKGVSDPALRENIMTAFFDIGDAFGLTDERSRALFAGLDFLTRGVSDLSIEGENASEVIDAMSKPAGDAALDYEAFGIAAETAGELILGAGGRITEAGEKFDPAKQKAEEFETQLDETTVGFETLATGAGVAATTLKGVTERMGEETATNLEPANEAVETFRKQWAWLVGAPKNLAFNIAFGSTGDGGSKGTGGTSDRAQGGSFMVPPGFNDDSFRVNVSSGERVTVQTPEQQRRGGSEIPNIEINIYGAADPQATGDEVIRRLDEELLGAGIGVL